MAYIGKKPADVISTAIDATTGTFSGNVTTAGTLGVTGAITGTLATAAQTNITSVGTLTSFASTGIDDNADAIAITIDSSENVGIGTASPTEKLSLLNSGGDVGIRIQGNTRSFKLEQNNYGLRIYDIDASSERMRIDSAGRVGIGQSSPDSESLVDLGSGENSGFSRKLLVTNTGNSRAGFGALSNIFRVFYADDQNLQFGTVSRDGSFTFIERMRIDSSGHLMLNTTTERNGGNLSIDYAGASQGGIGINDTGSANGSSFIGFLTGGTFRGSITNNNNTAVAYNTTSDHRLKENVVTEWDATTRLKQLKPSRFNFIADADRTVDGFLAHEVQDIVPEAITGTKDEVDADGNEVHQGIDQSKLVPLLVKTIQELEARITALEGV